MMTAIHPHPAWIEIDLAQLKKNIHIIREFVAPSKVCLAVKANAYGHGLVETSKAAVDAGIAYLGVSCLQEGAALREAGIQIPILVLGAIHEDQINELMEYQLEITIASLYKAKLVAQYCASVGKTCRVHVEVDTGIRRTGVRAQSAKAIFSYLQSEKCFEIIGVYSHFADAGHKDESLAHQQIAEFLALTKELPPMIRGPILQHLANSNGVAYFKESHLDMVRVGIMAYGYVPANAPPALQGIKPCFSLKSKVAYFKVVPQGAGISYGHTYVTAQQTRIITIPVGYGDGYRRALSNKAHVIVRGKRFPIAGTVCMDQFMVDVGDQEVYVGDEVILMGGDENLSVPLIEIAQLCSTIPNEILTAFGERIPRVYLNS